MSIKDGFLASTKEFSIPISTAFLSPFLASHPEWTLAWYSAIGLFGVYMYYNQSEINDLVRFIDEHPEVFAKEIVESKEFKESFIVFLDSYFKQRGDDKKELLRNGLLKATIDKDFELEKFYSILSLLSKKDLLALKYIANIKIPALKQKWLKNYETYNQKQSESESEFIEGILNRGVDIREGGFEDAELNKLSLSREDFNEALISLSNVGILTRSFSYSITQYMTNPFGIRFIEFMLK